MSVNFGTLKTQVGNRVGDTGATFASIIGTFINQRYKEVLRRVNFNVINPDYTLTATSASTIVSASTYKLPSDFGKELHVYDTVSKIDIPLVTMEQLEQQYYSTLQTVGTVESYAIFETTDSTAASAEASAARCKKIRFFKAPGTDEVFTIPYTMRPADLSADSDQLVIDCETAVEYGAVADAWMYKRAFRKAENFEGLYERAIQALIWDKTNQPNQEVQFNVQALNRSEGI